MTGLELMVVFALVFLACAVLEEESGRGKWRR